jgi:large conductance mechanosensitive channel
MKRFIGEFKEFAVRGNVMDLAVGIIIGTAFTAVVNSLVKDVLMPPLGLLLRKVDFSNLYINLSQRDYSSLSEAQSAGAPTINYGIFINSLITFLITAFVIFLMVRWINAIRRTIEERKALRREATKECPYCFSNINMKATRCPHCTSPLT